MRLIDLITPNPQGRRYSNEDLGLYLNPQDTIPRNAAFIDQTLTPIVPAGGAAVLFDYLVPSFRRGILKRLAVDAIDPAALPSIRYSVWRNRSTVPNYQNVEAPIGTIGEPDTVNVTFDREQLLQIQVTNSSFFAYEVSVRIVAWFWDEVVEAGR